MSYESVIKPIVVKYTKDKAGFIKVTTVEHNGNILPVRSLRLKDQRKGAATLILETYRFDLVYEEWEDEPWTEL